MKLEELKVYELSMNVGERVWSIVNKWSYFEKDTVNKQLVRASDSVATNLSEGNKQKIHIKLMNQMKFIILRTTIFSLITFNH